MPKLILHIGAHKTGTTSIQNFLHSNPDFLAQHNLIYPRICWFHFAQHRLAFALKGMADPVAGDRPRVATELASLLEVLAASEKDVIISSEVFFALPLKVLQPLRAGLEGWDVRIIASIRRQDNLMMSIYNQQTKNTRNKQWRPISFYLNDPLTVSPDMDLYSCLNSWAELFGREKMTTYCFERGDAVTVFLESLGLPVPETASTAKYLNEGVPAKTVELLRLIKMFARDGAAPTLDGDVNRVILDAARQVFEGSGSVLLSPTDRSRVLRHFEADNEKLFSDYFGGENLYAEKYWSVEFQKSGLQPTETLNRKDLVQLVLALAETIAKKERLFDGSV